MFIKGYAKAKNLPQTLKALHIAERLHEGQTRKTGDPFIIHPLRVCSYLIALNIDDDVTCAAALLHEVLKKCNLERNGEELIEDFNLSPEVLEIVKINYKSLLIKLSNRANTCTMLKTLSDDEKKEYIIETRNYINSICRYGEAYYTDYSDQIIIMQDHINALCNIVFSFLKKE